MTRENNYIIEILFDAERSKEFFIGTIPYLGSASFVDNISIHSTRILIDAKRSSIIPLESIFYNHSSSLYNQIIKTLVYYYCCTKKFIKIRSISILRTRGKQILAQKEFKSNEFSQVLDQDFSLAYSIDRDRLMELFNETPKGITTLVAASYILKANSSFNQSDRFEKLWKSFNKLFIHIGQDTKDFNCLRNLKQFVANNPAVTIHSSAKVHTITTNRLRNSIRWRAMILDNYDTEAKTEAFRDFVLRYSDRRIMEVLLETQYGYRENFLRKNNFFNAVDNRIQNSIGNNILNDNDIITLLTGKYMYFVRNKTFHGEKIDSTFRLSVNKEETELLFLNTVLEAYLIDLINCNHLY